MAHDQGKLAVFLAHRADLIDYATPIVGDRMRAEDVVQDAYIRFMPGDGGGPALDQPVGYLYRIVRNLALDLTRRRAMEHRQQGADLPWWLVPAEPRTPEQEVSHRRSVERIATALDGLSPQARLAVEMHRFGGHTLGEIATRLGVSVPTAHRLVRDALLKIAAGMDPDMTGGDDGRRDR
ncbi:sigma-70 family RNA polymerase sigma factor [Tistrella bauzanensis]|uniref:Sigma-70 family RNA polymerase sigma factor n=1 Tax=Tistrella arctica TaxID=3133430 RepID=A0ABU9YMQ6_9PROT